ncbi:MAG: flavodoxin family protein [Candidatus Bathyarchaeota archaeon]|nr:flavodoxin family protein [Candidatus Bathyarchaeota archaeon]
MNCIAIQSSPNEIGLTASLAQAVLNGVKESGGATELVHLNQYDIQPCIACDNGWGQCREKGTCILEDDFEALRQKLVTADTLVFATPVYFGGLSESATRFLDRLRRCERASGFTAFTDKKIIGITSAGGSGRGAVRALYHLEDYLRRFRFEILDLVSVTRFSKDRKLPMLKTAGQQLIAK